MIYDENVRLSTKPSRRKRMIP